MEAHIRISLGFLWKHIGNYSLSTLSVFVENFWNLVEMFVYIGDMRAATHLEKLWKLDGNYIRKFLGIRLEFNFGTVWSFFGNVKKIRLKYFGMELSPLE